MTLEGSWKIRLFKNHVPFLPSKSRISTAFLGFRYVITGGRKLEMVGYCASQQHNNSRENMEISAYFSDLDPVYNETYKEKHTSREIHRT